MTAAKGNATRIVAPPSVARMSPCPCGSGRRYKDCHGSLGAPAAAAARSRYRPSGSDWSHVADAERDRLGARMEAAFAHHREGRLREAEQNYREVLATAPATHDALHMLGLIRWQAGDLQGARRLIEQALPLRPEYPAITKNLALVISTQRAKERHAQEALCERALPVLFDLLRSPESGVARQAAPAAGDLNETVELIGHDDGSDGDDAWMLRRLAKLLAPLGPVVRPAPGGIPGAPLADRDGALSQGGIQVVVGVDLDVAGLSRGATRLTVVLAQSAAPSRWLDALRALAHDGTRPLALVAESRAKAARFGEGHLVLPPPIDVDEFAAAEGRSNRDDSRGFVAGCVVQDGRTVAHTHTGALLQRAAAHGFALDLLDPGRARYALGVSRHVKCFSRRETTLADFVAPLSCLIYRAEAWWKEGSGRDLFGAMAAGVPVVCPRGSIYAEYLQDGVDALLYDDEAGALAALATLRSDPARAAAIGAAARVSARHRFDPATLAAAYRGLVIGPAR